jgi:hypothetical protein
LAAYGDGKAKCRIFYGSSARARSKKGVEEVPIALTAMTAHHQRHSMARWRQPVDLTNRVSRDEVWKASSGDRFLAAAIVMLYLGVEFYNSLREQLFKGQASALRWRCVPPDDCQDQPELGY